MKKEVFHTPVLLQEVVEVLDPKDRDLIVDATIGGAGHSKVLAKGARGITVVGFEADPQTAKLAEDTLKKEGIEGMVLNQNFRNLGRVLEEENIHPTKILFDLGLSEFSLFSSGRGFSFQSSEPLDMRFDPQGQALTAADIVNDWEAKDLENVLRAYGEEGRAHRIVRAIISAREEKRILRADELAEIIEKALGRKMAYKTYPATRTFQALRMAVNDELDVLREGLEGAWKSLLPGGRLAVISFHSIEDRVVKIFFKEKAKEDSGHILTKKPITASKEELKDNPKSRSAKLRAIEKLLNPKP